MEALWGQLAARPKVPMSTPKPPQRPEQSEAEEAVRVLLRWAGEDPGREGLRDTPARVARRASLSPGR